jgi:topoisomerase-4 subunit B
LGRRILQFETGATPVLRGGEISPKEFAQFIGKEMRLSKVEYAPRAESGPIFSFYMGKNTPERKDYVMDKLVVPVEE